MAPGGNTGNAVGSVQDYATGLPQNPFTTNTTGNHTHVYERGNRDSARDEPGGDHNIWDDNDDKDTSRAGNHSHTITGGGDQETRPINVYVIWVIKY
jgi:hypothetical protein